MIVQDLYLEDYDWRVRIYYADEDCHREDVLADIETLGVFGGEIAGVESLLSGCRDNEGFTFSLDGISLVYIGPTSSAAEFNNTYDHEKGHLAKHIARRRGIGPWGEAYQYLAGEIAYRTFPYARHFLCDRCRTNEPCL